MDQLLLIHEAAVLLPVFRRRQVAEQALLNDFLAIVDGTAEHSLARAALTDSHDHVGSQRQNTCPQSHDTLPPK